jgi:hypothetical protein
MQATMSTIRTTNLTWLDLLRSAMKGHKPNTRNWKISTTLLYWSLEGSASVRRKQRMTQFLTSDHSTARSSDKKAMTLVDRNFIDLNSIESLFWLVRKPILHPALLSYPWSPPCVSKWRLALSLRVKVLEQRWQEWLLVVPCVVRWRVTSFG